MAGIIEAGFTLPEPALEAACLMGKEDAMQGRGRKEVTVTVLTVRAGQRTNSWNERERRLTHYPGPGLRVLFKTVKGGSFTWIVL